MRSISVDMQNAIAAGTVAYATFVKIEFPGGTVALNTSNYTLDWDGTTYTGAGPLGQISPITDKPGELPGMKLELTLVDSNYLALALDEADEVQGSLVTISTAVLDAETHEVLDVLTDWIGYGDTMSISEDGQTASIAMSCEAKGVDLLRGSPLVYNDADQQSIVPGDRYLEYVTSQTDKRWPWPTREFFQR